MNIRQPLTRYRLQKIINVREQDLLEPDPPATLQALEDYAEGTASQLLQLQVGPGANATIRVGLHSSSSFVLFMVSDCHGQASSM